MATAFTFFVSAILHELVMGCITKKLRGYGFVAVCQAVFHDTNFGLTQT
jgi:hypothetical protein